MQALQKEVTFNLCVCVLGGVGEDMKVKIISPVNSPL